MIQATFVEIPSIDSLPSTPVANQVNESAVTSENKSFSDALQRQQQALSGGQKNAQADTKTSVEPETSQDDQATPDSQTAENQAAIGNVLPAQTAAVAVSLPGVIIANSLEPALQSDVAAVAANSFPSTAADLIESRAVLVGQPVTAGAGVGKNLLAGVVDDVDQFPPALTGDNKPLAPTRGIDFIEVSARGSKLTPPGVSEAVQVKPALVSGGDQVSPLPISFNSSLSVHELPAGSNGQMVDLIAGGARGEGASTGSVVGKPGLAPIDIPVNDPRWGNAVAQRVVMATKQGLQQAQITVTPANLGPIELQIQIQDDKASVTMVSPHASVRELLEGATPRLRELFEQQGLTLQDSHVADQDSERGQFAENESTGTADELLDSGEVEIDQGGMVFRGPVGLVDRYA